MNSSKAPIAVIKEKASGAIWKVPLGLWSECIDPFQRGDKVPSLVAANWNAELDGPLMRFWATGTGGEDDNAVITARRGVIRLILLGTT